MSEDIRQKFLEFYDHHADAIFRHCFFRVYDRELAKDLVQEVFCRFWVVLQGDKKYGHSSAFLYRIAHNLIIDYSRKKHPLSLDQLLEQGLNLQDGSHLKLEQTIDARHVYKLLYSLHPDYQSIVVMRFIDGIGPSEIAEILGLSENVVSVRLNRAIKKLRKMTEQSNI